MCKVENWWKNESTKKFRVNRAKEHKNNNASYIINMQNGMKKCVHLEREYTHTARSTMPKTWPHKHCYFLYFELNNTQEQKRFNSNKAMRQKKTKHTRAPNNEAQSSIIPVKNAHIFHNHSIIDWYAYIVFFLRWQMVNS